MFRLNRLTDYAVVVMTQMTHRPEEVHTAPQIANDTGIPLPTVAKLLNALARESLVVSHRGAAGGYTLGRSAEEISVAEIIQVLEGPIALTACTSHVYDLGGLGMGPDASDVFDEGLFLPPLKLVERGEVNSLVMHIVKANSRSPVSNEGDIYALIACCDVAHKRLSEMMSEFGIGSLGEVGAYIHAVSRSASEAAINAVPRGTYENRMMIDGYDGVISWKG